MNDVLQHELLLWYKSTLLAVKHRQPDGSPAPYWATPGGGLNPNESLECGLISELYEETGKHARIGKLLFVQQFAPSVHREDLEFFFLIDNPEDFIRVDTRTSSHGAAEISEIAFINPGVEIIRPAFLQEVNLEQLITTNMPVQLYTELPQ